MIKPTKEADFWSFLRTHLLLSVLAFVVIFITFAFVVTLFVDVDLSLDTVAFSIMLLIGWIVGMFLAVPVYAKTRRVTKEVAKNTSVLYLVIGGVFLLGEMMHALIRPEYGFASVICIIIGTPVIFLVVKTLLLQKAKQQEYLWGSEEPSETAEVLRDLEDENE